MTFCIKCGTALKLEWNTCPICGQNLKLAVVTPHTIQQTIQSITTNRQNLIGIIALIFGILALSLLVIFLLLFIFFFLYIGSFIFSLIAIIIGKKGMEIDNNPSIAKRGHDLGIVGLSGCFILIITIISLWSISGCC